MSYIPTRHSRTLFVLLTGQLLGCLGIEETCFFFFIFVFFLFLLLELI